MDRRQVQIPGRDGQEIGRQRKGRGHQGPVRLGLGLTCLCALRKAKQAIPWAVASVSSNSFLILWLSTLLCKLGQGISGRHVQTFSTSLLEAAGSVPMCLSGLPSAGFPLCPHRRREGLHSLRSTVS